VTNTHRLKLAAVLAMAAVSLSGCVHTWDKPGATAHDFNVDEYACERDVRQSNYFGGGIAGAINMQTFFDKCMTSKDWVVHPGQGGQFRGTM
jgi:hypothetical protein